MMILVNVYDNSILERNPVDDVVVERGAGVWVTYKLIVNDIITNTRSLLVLTRTSTSELK